SNLALETVLRIDSSGKVVPWLAQKVSHPNPYVWIYTLRKGVKFWDGNELTAEDVAASINYFRYPGSVAAYQYPVPLRGVKATGRYTGQVTLKQKDAAWPFVLTGGTAGIFEKKFFDEHKDSYGKPGTLIMGTGPYKIDNFDPTRGIDFSANDSYW